jgi:hypothetical protein
MNRLFAVIALLLAVTTQPSVKNLDMDPEAGLAGADGPTPRCEATK